MRWLLLILMVLSSYQAAAAFDKCVGVYVGRISIHHQQGIDKVVLMSSSSDTGGSYWVYFTGWAPDAKKEALSVLMAAKASNHRVDIYTKAEDKCSIGTPGQVFNEIHLSTNP